MGEKVFDELGHPQSDGERDQTGERRPEHAAPGQEEAAQKTAGLRLLHRLFVGLEIALGARRRLAKTSSSGSMTLVAKGRACSCASLAVLGGTTVSPSRRKALGRGRRSGSVMRRS